MSPLGQWGCPNSCKFELALCTGCGHKYGVDTRWSGGLVQSGKCMECRDNRFRSFSFKPSTVFCFCGKHVMNTPYYPGVWAMELDERGVKHGFDRCPPDEDGTAFRIPLVAPMTPRNAAALTALEGLGVVALCAALLFVVFRYLVP